MNWGGSEAFFAMGGYALYVWGSYAMTAVLIAAEVILLVMRRRGILSRLRGAAAARSAP